MAEKMIYSWAPRVHHLAVNGQTLCGINTLSLWRVRMGSKGDGLPCCAKCAKKEDAAAKPTKGGA